MALSNVVYTDFDAIDEKIDWESKYDSSWNDEDYPDPFVPMVINRAESDLCSGDLAYHDGYDPEYKPKTVLSWRQFDTWLDAKLDC